MPRDLGRGARRGRPGRSRGAGRRRRRARPTASPSSTTPATSPAARRSTSARPAPVEGVDTDGRRHRRSGGRGRRRGDRRGRPARAPRPSGAARTACSCWRGVRALNPRALVVCAGAAQLALVERAVLEQGADRRRLFGAAPEALRSAMVALTSLEAGCSPARRVAGRAGPAARRTRSCRGPTPPSPGCAPPTCSTRRHWPASTRGCRGCGRPARSRWPPPPAAWCGLALAGGPGSACLFAVPERLGDVPTRGAALPAPFRPRASGVAMPRLSTRDRVRLEGVLGR